jgi:hypothetical protein
MIKSINAKMHQEEEITVDISVEPWETPIITLKAQLAIYMNSVSEYATDSELGKSQKQFAKLSEDSVSIERRQMGKFLKKLLKKYLTLKDEQHKELLNFLLNSDDFSIAEFMQRSIAITKLKTHDKSTIKTIFKVMAEGDEIPVETIRKVLSNFFTEGEELEEALNKVSKGEHSDFKTFNNFMHQ